MTRLTVTSDAPVEEPRDVSEDIDESHDLQPVSIAAPRVGSRWARAVAFRLLVTGALEALDDRSRELIALRYGADLSARQIAELEGARTNTVEVALHRAVARLRAACETSTAPAAEL